MLICATYSSWLFFFFYSFWCFNTSDSSNVKYKHVQRTQNITSHTHTREKQVKCTPCETREFPKTPTTMLLPAYVGTWLLLCIGRWYWSKLFRLFALSKYTCETTWSNRKQSYFAPLSIIPKKKFSRPSLSQGQY